MWKAAEKMKAKSGQFVALLILFIETVARKDEE